MINDVRGFLLSLNGSELIGDWKRHGPLRAVNKYFYSHLQKQVIIDNGW